MDTGFLSEVAREALTALAETVLDDAGLVRTVADDDASPLRLEPDELDSITASELRAAVGEGIVLVDDGEHYLSEDAVAALTGERIAVSGQFAGDARGVLCKYDDVLFDGGEGLRVGWVSSIPADWAPGALFTVTDDRAATWNIRAEDIAEFRE